MFIPSFVDDYGFTPEEFRVLARIMRRCAGRNSQGFFESIPHISKAVQISERIVRRSLKVLVYCNAVRRESRPGRTDLFQCNSFDKWKPKSALETIRSEVDLVSKFKDRVRKHALPSNSEVVAEMTRVGNANGSPLGKDARPVTEKTEGVVAETPGKENLLKDTELRNNKPAAGAADVNEVFEECRNVLNPDAKLDRKRMRIIQARLRDGFTVEQLKMVPHGVLLSPYHMGQNENSTPYQKIETIYRDADQVEHFIGLFKRSTSASSKINREEGVICEKCEGRGLMPHHSGNGYTRCDACRLRRETENE